MAPLLRRATPNKMKKIRVLLVDDHMVVREGLRAMLATAEDLEIVGEAGDGWEAVRMVRTTAPEVVVMDVAMPQLNGLGAMKEVLKQAPSVKVLVLSSYGENECVEELIAAGAAGYLVKHTAATDLHRAIQEVHRGRKFFSPAVVQRMRERGRYALPGGQLSKSTGRGGELTARELQVLKLVALGFSNRQAAAELDISIKTIEKHRQQVMNKLNMHEVTSLTRYAMSQGMVDRNDPGPGRRETADELASEKEPRPACP